MSDYTQFECLPNELFVEIFGYFTLEDLYESFKGLNQRVDHILQSLNNRALELWSTNASYKHPMNIFFSSVFVSLHISDDYNINLNQFPRTHSLTYAYATDYQLQHFLQATFCQQHLMYLNVTSDDLSLLIKYIYSNTFPLLKQCILRNIDSKLTGPWRMTPSLSSIIVCSDENLIPLILNSCPRLERLSLSISEYSDISSLFIFVHQHLQHLSIEMIQPGWTVKAIDILFSSIHLPNLISFNIYSCEPSSTSFDFVQLTKIFHERLPNLHRFDCSILVSQGLEVMDIKTIRSLHEFFFNHLKIEYRSTDIVKLYTKNRRDYN